MIALSTTVLAGALAEVAAAATINNGINGIIGNRADAVFTRSVRAISAGFRSLAGHEDEEVSRQIILSVNSAFKRSFYRYIDTISTQSSNHIERIAVEDLRREFDKVELDGSAFNPFSISHAVRPLLAGLTTGAVDPDLPALAIVVKCVVGWCEQHAGPFPESFARILTERAPNNQPSWLDSFRSELANETVNNEAYQKLLIVSNLSSISEVSSIINSISISLSSDICHIKTTVQTIDQRVYQIQEAQADQNHYFRQLISLLPPVGLTSGNDACLRVLASCMFDRDGQPTPASLIILSAFYRCYAIEQLDRHARLTLIREVHGRLTEGLEREAYIMRFDAGEFDIVLRNIKSIIDLQELCTRVARLFLRPFEVDGNMLTLTPKLGAALSPEHGFSPESLQRNADLALRYALPYGTDDIVIYRRGLRSDADARRSLEHDLRSALRNSEFYLVYQPIVRIEGNLISGFEALIRWSNAKRGHVSPADFIPVAEEMGLLPEIGEWIVRTACIHATQWPEDIRLAVNVSPIQFKSRKFVDLVRTALTASGLNASRLELEVTEGIFLEESQAYNDILDDFRRLNVRITLDDFGTGYSSLGYLRNAPISTIKIDQSFSRGIGRGGANGSIVIAILALCKSMELDVIAEGIESDYELGVLQELGCSYAQGYLFGRPLTQSESIKAAKRGTVERGAAGSKLAK